MRATIRDIALAANVSIGTVSRALKKQSGLTEQTRIHVQRIASQLGYNEANLRQGKIRRLTFLLHRQHNNFVASPFFSQVLHGVETACRERSIVPTVLSIGPADNVMEQIRLHEPDALAVAGFMEPEVLEWLTKTGKPVVLIDLWAPGFRSVNIDNLGGALTATRHLMQLGRQRLAFISGPLSHYSIAQRALGYRQALFEAGRLFDPRLEITLQPGQELQQQAAAAMQTLLLSGPPPDAIFCYNDATALAVMNVCQARGLRIPEDIAIVGFDNIDGAASAAPPLTTLAVDKEALGRMGMQLLLDDAPAQSEVVLPVELIQRASTLGSGALP
ncbi:LacI family DNA-binding transcriptional regulator [Collimonas pratensis]|uniref:Periplasmic binding s and sugar binding domain of LacI family protein n=1 Tax=Collimonas pratensis TaxID=279113 RepID=A0ABN4M9W6_9BURK|nr:LacI family DNA-binding transcriptional regulator [Collimonas pratensis]AMP13009.1 periplasmic binding s and sugar binding domain of LacI family protein [Collimonas pratensis]NKI72775.1 substrate-binding domain-containing protein [Collimonas pratensis]